jgi:hypothetical protein
MGNKQARDTLKSSMSGLNLDNSVKGERSILSSLNSTFTDHNSEGMLQHSFLKTLPKGLATVHDLVSSQTDEQRNSTIQMLNRFSSGRFNKTEMDAIYQRQYGKGGEKARAGQLDVLEKKLGDFMGKNRSKLSDMSESERYKYIMENVMPGEDMATFAYLQRSSGQSGKLGSVDLKSLGAERYSLGNLGNAKELARELSSATTELAGTFHDKSGVTALLKTDSASRNLFLSAIDGKKDAQSLLEDKLDDATKDKLLNKFGLKEADLDQIRRLYEGKGDNSKSALDKFSTAMDRSSAGAIITQMRRQGIGMGNRLQNASASVKELLGGFTGQLSGLDTKNFDTFLGSSNISDTLDRVAGLKGDQRAEAISVLGTGAKTAFDYASGVNRQLHQRGGLDRLYKGADDETKAYIDTLRKDGKFDEKDKGSLTKYLRDRTFIGSLSSDGKVMGKDIQGAEKMTETIQSIAKNAREAGQLNLDFARINTQFAQLVINSSSELKGDTTVVNNMRQVTEQLSNKK